MIESRLLLTLLVHRRTQEKYYQDHELSVEKQKKLVEEIYRIPFDNIPEDRRLYYLNIWFWPPWRFNDIVGFAEIEMETDWTVIGHLYLPEGRFSRQKPLLLNYACASADFEQNNLQSLREAIIEVTEQLQSILSKRKWRLEFSREWVNHTDFLAMIRAREKIHAC